MPAIDWLSMNLPSPASSFASSLRRRGWPMYCSMVAMAAPYLVAIWPAASRTDATMFW